jgi:hypothetical protein
MVLLFVYPPLCDDVREPGASLYTRGSVFLSLKIWGYCCTLLVINLPLTGCERHDTTAESVRNTVKYDWTNPRGRVGAPPVVLCFHSSLALWISRRVMGIETRQRLLILLTVCP